MLFFFASVFPICYFCAFIHSQPRLDMKIQKPKKLQKGDTIGLISPASALNDPENLKKGIEYLEKLGYKVKVGTFANAKKGYLAGEDSQRLEDLHNMFADKNVNAIFCIRGGYGSGRLLDKVDYNLIRKNPKIFVGYSDITALQMAMLQKAGLVTFAGPMPGSTLQEGIDASTEEMFWKILTNNKKIGKLSNPHNEKFYILAKGRASGPMIGGNLCLVTSLMGTEYLPKFKDCVLMLEEIDEAPYRVDRMLNQLRLAGVFDEISGLILGRFINCVEHDHSKKTLTINEVIDDYFGKAQFPVMYNFIHGHVKESLTVPYGINIKMNTAYNNIEIDENAVI